MKKLKKLSFLLLFIICNSAAFALHIVGGEIYYKYLGNNKYSLKLFLYRNCNTNVNPALLNHDDFRNITGAATFHTKMRCRIVEKWIIKIMLR